MVLPQELEFLPSARGRPPASSIRRRSAPTARCCGNIEFFAVDRELEIAPGCSIPAWTYNGQVPGPTIRATEGDRIRVNFLNQGTHPHTIHFHGWHPPAMDGALEAHQVLPGETFHLRVRRRAVRPPPLSLSCSAAEAAHSQRPLRGFHRRSQGAAARRPTSS